MKRFNITIIYLLLGLFIASPSHSQEVEVGLKNNPTILKYISEKGIVPAKSMNSNDTLTLPFFDDFSNYTIFPADSLWEDNYVFINTGFAILPPTNGVATFDALDETGHLHSNASSSTFQADKLTSLPIDLEGLAYSDSIFLSFYYQPKGIGDVPEGVDSLAVEFYSPETDEWYWMWSTNDFENTNFRAAIIQVPDTSIFYKKGFKFRFKNYATITGLFEPSFASNADFWHVDYVILDSGRTNSDTTIVDLAFLSTPGYLLDNYVSMPWSHFLINDSEMVDEFDISFVNHRDNSIIVNRDIEIFDLIDGGAPIEVIGSGGASDNFPPGDTIISHPISYTFTSSGTDYAKFLIKAHIKPGEIVADYSANNDTASYVQIFDNYYAHDDGSPENGYGVGGEGTQNALLANKFRSYKMSDSLRAIDIYFNETLGGASQDYFYLQIWAEDETTGNPGDILYSKIGMRPEYEDSLYKFHRYNLLSSDDQDTAIVVPNTFFVGWKKTTLDILNVGFDKNMLKMETVIDNGDTSIVNPWIYFNATGVWQQSSKVGALMIRPVFSQTPLVSINETVVEEIQSNLYPNPNNGIFTIDFNGEIFNEDIFYNVISSDGRIVKSGIYDSAYPQINISDMPDGIYFIRLNSPKRLLSNHKIILIH